MSIPDHPTLFSQVVSCELCKDIFASTSTGHKPRPVFQGHPTAKLLIAGQAPGARAYQSGQPFTDRSGDRLRNWMGLDRNTFYDADRVAILPMGFCFPGYDTKGSDLPPLNICSKKWRVDMLALFSNIKLTLLVGGYAQKWHLKTKECVDRVVSNWQKYQPKTLPLPHPSWRNNTWIKSNPWFEANLVPFLRQSVEEVLK